MPVFARWVKLPGPAENPALGGHLLSRIGRPARLTKKKTAPVKNHVDKMFEPD
jgi:hypothetical protein